MKLSSNIEEDGRQFACPGELVIFTCEVIQSSIVQMAAEDFICLNDPISFVASNDIGSSGPTTPTDIFQANLTNVQRESNQTSVANFTVTLKVKTTNETNNTEVVCAGQRTSQREKLTISGRPK